jgi:hypothetical protein
VPRIQRITPRRASNARAHLSIHALVDLNVTREAIFGAVHAPFSRGFFSSDSADLVFTGAQRNGGND